MAHKCSSRRASCGSNRARLRRKSSLGATAWGRDSVLRPRTMATSACPKETTQASEDREGHGVLPVSIGVGKDGVQRDAERTNVGDPKERNDAGRQHFWFDQVHAHQHDRGCSRCPSELQSSSLV
jgi:hypothetical protein